MKLEEVIMARKRAARMLKEAHIAIAHREAENIEISDFGLGDLDNVGLLVVTYENNDRYCGREIVLRPGDQYTLPPDTLHWFQAGDKGAILSEFSSKSLDENDIWTDARLRRLPKIE